MSSPDLYVAAARQIPPEFHPILESQRLKGQRTYGQSLNISSPLSGQPPSVIGAIIEAVQELIDGMLYLELAKEKAAPSTEERISLGLAQSRLKDVLDLLASLSVGNCYNLEKSEAD